MINLRRKKMDLETLKDTPPWEWPKDAGDLFLGVVSDHQAAGSERLLAVELAGDMTVINDGLVDALLSILCSGDESEELRGGAAISLGPALEYAYIDGFEDPDDIPISEQTFLRIQKTLRKLYMDPEAPRDLRRRVLEASVRAPQDWHQDPVRAAYSSDDEEWKLTAVFSMRFIRGFDEQILESLDSRNPDIHYQAVCAAGNWEMGEAWSHVAALLSSEETDKELLLAAIEAAVGINPQKAPEILFDFTESEDEDIAEAAHEAMVMAGALSELEDLDDEEFFP
jgi:hypothetical protein